MMRSSSSSRMRSNWASVSLVVGAVAWLVEFVVVDAVVDVDGDVVVAVSVLNRWTGARWIGPGAGVVRVAVGRDRVIESARTAADTVPDAGARWTIGVEPSERTPGRIGERRITAATFSAWRSSGPR
jgi:hypothetical protein